MLPRPAPEFGNCLNFPLRADTDAKDAPKRESADEDLRRVRAAVRVAQEVGARLGSGEVLFRLVSLGEGLRRSEKMVIIAGHSARPFSALGMR